MRIVSFVENGVTKSNILKFFSPDACVCQDFDISFFSCSKATSYIWVLGQRIFQSFVKRLGLIRKFMVKSNDSSSGNRQSAEMLKNPLGVIVRHFLKTLNFYH